MISKIDDITANYHGGNLRSIEAHESIRDVKYIQRKRILKYISRQGEKGATCDEAELVLGISHQTCSARFTELKVSNQIISIGKRPTRSGRNANVFIVMTEWHDSSI